MRPLGLVFKHILSDWVSVNACKITCDTYIVIFSRICVLFNFKNNRVILFSNGKSFENAFMDITITFSKHNYVSWDGLSPNRP